MQKIFIAATVEAAVASARREMGGDAYLVDVLPNASEGGGYRVLFASKPTGAVDNDPEPVTQREERGGASAHRIGELREELNRLSSLVACLASSNTVCPARPALTRIAALLRTFDLPVDTAQQILVRMEQRLGREEGDAAVRALLSEELESLVRFDPNLGTKARRTVVSLVGPPGVGKTSMLVKLAMRFGVSARRQALILTTDTQRVGSADQLRSYAGVLGLPFQAVESPCGLPSVVAEHRGKELILVDTPGFGPRDWDLATEWAEALGACRELRTQLVLPATMRAMDLREMVRRWAVFQPDHLMFTHMDGTTSYGGCVAAAIESGKPVSWLGLGQDIPDDLAPASADRLFGDLLGHDLKTLAAVA